MVTKFDHNLVVAGKPSTKVTLGHGALGIGYGEITSSYSSSPHLHHAQHNKARRDPLN
jgi:hypothetical protein